MSWCLGNDLLMELNMEIMSVLLVIVSPVPAQCLAHSRTSVYIYSTNR